MITPKCRLPDVAVQLLPPEVEEFLETGSQVSYNTCLECPRGRVAVYRERKKRKYPGYQ